MTRGETQGTQAKTFDQTHWAIGDHAAKKMKDWDVITK
jgi:hypothetical protein